MMFVVTKRNITLNYEFGYWFYVNRKKEILFLRYTAETSLRTCLLLNDPENVISSSNK